MKKLWIILMVLSLTLIGTEVLHAAQFEVSYPEIAGVKPENVGDLGPLGWVRYAFYLAYALVGIAAFWGLLQASITRLTSTNSEKIAEANDRIKGVMIGLAFAAVSVVTLELINPDFVNLRQPTIDRTLYQGGNAFNYGTDQLQQCGGYEGDQGGFCGICNDDGGCNNDSWAAYKCDTPTGLCKVKGGRPCGNSQQQISGANPCETGYYCADNNNGPNTCKPGSEAPPEQPACSDGRDNDADSKTDLADPGCSSPTDTSEVDSGVPPPPPSPLQITAPSSPIIQNQPAQFTFTFRPSGEVSGEVTFKIDWGDAPEPDRKVAVENGVARLTLGHAWNGIPGDYTVSARVVDAQGTETQIVSVPVYVNQAGQSSNPPPPPDRPASASVTRGTYDSAAGPIISSYRETSSLPPLTSLTVSGPNRVTSTAEVTYIITARSNPNTLISFEIFFRGHPRSVSSLLWKVRSDAEGVAQITMGQKFVAASAQGSGASVDVQAASVNLNGERGVITSTSYSILVTSS